MYNAYINNPTLTKFGKLNSNVFNLSVEVGNKIFESFPKESIDAFVFSSFAPENYTQEYHLAAKISSQLNLPQVFSIRTETASSSGASAIHTAYYLLQTGKFKNVLVIGAESMTGFDREQNNLLLGSVLSDNQRNFKMSMAQGAAMIANLYLKKYGYTREDLYYIAEKLHENGSHNKNAHIQKPITKEDYFNSPMFSSPLCLYDISPISDGAAGCVLSTEKRSQWKIIGTGHGRDDFYKQSLDTSFLASRYAFEKAFLESKIKSHEIDIAELHDAFTIFEVIGAEDAGLFPRGKGLEFLKEGDTHPNGKIPINTSGGLKTRGHPIGASGIAQIVELCTSMQKKNKTIGLAHSIGGLATNNFATMIEQIY
jgi:acetyl-CoA acetyltransferase